MSLFNLFQNDNKEIVSKPDTSKRPIRGKYFYVYQNKTYHEERLGRFLWAPKYASGNGKNAGYETMKDEEPDVLFLLAPGTFPGQ
ncbi:MAG: hypothetical protein IKB62_08285 [Oscillospiraceae bacterium]|nr:hypothetical protein [Oscillospiraceae bacterium]